MIYDITSPSSIRDYSSIISHISFFSSINFLIYCSAGEKFRHVVSRLCSKPRAHFSETFRDLEEEMELEGRKTGKNVASPVTQQGDCTDLIM